MMKYTIALNIKHLFVVIVQSLSHVSLFATPWTAVHQASLSFTISWSLLNFMSSESVMLSNHFTLCGPLFLLPSIFPYIRVFPTRRLFTSGVQSIRDSVATTVLPMNIQSWFPLGLTGVISLQNESVHMCSLISVVSDSLRPYKL